MRDAFASKYLTTEVPSLKWWFSSAPKKRMKYEDA